MAHEELMEAGDLIMESAGYHQANMIEGYLAQLASMFPNGPPEAPAADPPPQEAPPADDDAPPAANSVTGEVRQQLLTQMQEMQTMMAALQANQANLNIELPSYLGSPGKRCSSRCLIF
jgi:hypothetical protein